MTITKPKRKLTTLELSKVSNTRLARLIRVTKRTKKAVVEHALEFYELHADRLDFGGAK